MIKIIESVSNWFAGSMRNPRYPHSHRDYNAGARTQGRFTNALNYNSLLPRANEVIEFVAKLLALSERRHWFMSRFG